MGEHDLIVKGIAAAANTKGDGLDALVAMNVAMFGDDDPDTMFVKWCVAAKRGSGLRAAADEMGLDVEDGPGFFERLRLAYIQKIQED